MLDAIVLDLLDDGVAVHADADVDVAVLGLVDLGVDADVDVDLLDDVFDPSLVKA